MPAHTDLSCRGYVTYSAISNDLKSQVLAVLDQITLSGLAVCAVYSHATCCKLELVLSKRGGSYSLLSGLFLNCSLRNKCTRCTQINEMNISDKHISGSNTDILRGNKLAVKLCQYLPQFKAACCFLLSITTHRKMSSDFSLRRLHLLDRIFKGQKWIKTPKTYFSSYL